MVWPFRASPPAVPVVDLESQLPSDLYSFFANHSLQLASSASSAAFVKPKLVYDRNNPEEVEKVERLRRFKRMFNTTSMAASNCETVSIVSHEVRRNNRLTKTGANAIQWTGKCISSQREALMHLGFEDAISVEQANLIAATVQETFVKHYGKHGSRLSEEDYDPFFAFMNDIRDERKVIWASLMQ